MRLAGRLSWPSIADPGEDSAQVTALFIPGPARAVPKALPRAHDVLAPPCGKQPLSHHCSAFGFFSGMFPSVQKCTLFPNGGGAAGAGSRAPWDLEGCQFSVPRVPSGGGGKGGCLHPSWAAGGYWTRLDSRANPATH